MEDATTDAPLRGGHATDAPLYHAPSGQRAPRRTTVGVMIGHLLRAATASAATRGGGDPAGGGGVARAARDVVAVEGGGGGGGAGRRLPPREWLEVRA